MHPVIAKSFGGLSTQYYIRQFLFGSAFPVFALLMMSRGNHPVNIAVIALFLFNSLLYPYSRFVYESVVGYIVGQNTFFVNAFVMLFTKAITMLLCWCFAIFIAPIGLVYLYIRNSKVNS